MWRSFPETVVDTHSLAKVSQPTAQALTAGGVAQLIERQAGTLLTRVELPGAARDFSLPESTFSADSLTLSVHPRVQSHAFTSVCMLKIPSFGNQTFVWTDDSTAHTGKNR